MGVKKKLSHKVSSKEIDKIYNLGIKNGALGGKIIGAGGGGFMMFLVPPAKQKKIKKILKLPEVKVEFTNIGSTIIYNNQ